MATLLLRLTGPMQSWGTQSRFSVRDSDLEPSFSGVVGLLAAALGRGRGESVADLCTLQMGVRVDREGVRMVDYHTAGGTHRQDEPYGVYKASGARAEAVVSRRYYLADADFLVGLEGDSVLLRLIDAALKRPAWPLFLGRRSFPPSVPPHMPGDEGLREESMEAVLRSAPWRRRVPEEALPDRLRLVLRTVPEDSFDVRMDVPLSFAPGQREFAARYLKTEWIPLPEVI